MTAEVLIARAQAEGVHLSTAPNGGLRCRGPLSPELKETLRARKSELLAALKEPAQRVEDGTLLEARHDLAAVRIRSDCGVDVWVARDQEIAAELRTEGSTRGERLPVLTFADVARLRNKHPEVIQAVLDVSRVFPGTRVIQ